ncbi:MAG: SxtJ family membrane protein [Melioribacteraceae bacterium]|nr:SxtJ family membrane protein [Melioribacteraceae bacterium]
MILEEIRNIKSDKKELKKFGGQVGGILILIGAFLFVFAKSLAPIFLGVGGLLVVLAFIIPKLLLPLQKVWMALAVVLGFVMTRVILSILFYLIITPINFISRVFGKDFLDLKIEKEKKSYWNLRDEKYKKSSTEKQF